MVMETIYLSNKGKNIEANVCALGFFDGFHLGHQELVKTVKAEADNSGLKKAVLTFDQNPKDFLNNQNDGYLMSLEDKEVYLEEQGFDYLFVFEFNEITARLQPEEFIQQYLIANNTKTVVCGTDFHFGYRGKGDFNCFRNFSNLECKIVQPLLADNKKIASRTIKNLLKQGNIKKANHQLGYNYSIQGPVIKGRQIGRTIGFPTANIDYFNYLLPAVGVYAGYLYHNNQKYLGMISIGYNATFDVLSKVSLEVHIIDFAADIYGEKVRVEFVDRIRNPEQFESKERLIEQLNLDKIRIIEMLG